MIECKSCGHVGSELRQRRVNGGALQIVHQCLNCGRSASNPLRHDSIRNSNALPVWDESIAAGYDARRAQAREVARVEWFDEHSEYLRSPQWKHKRDLVIKRCKGICEGCAAERVTQVHHLTYDHWRNELLWELVGVCDACHELAHSKVERVP